MAFLLNNFNQTSSGKNTQSFVAYTYLATHETSVEIARSPGYFNDLRNALRLNDIIEVVGKPGPTALTGNSRFQLRVSKIEEGEVDTVANPIPTTLETYLNADFFSTPAVRSDALYPVTFQLGLIGYNVLGVQYYFKGTVGGTDLDLSLGVSGSVATTLIIPDPEDTRSIEVFPEGMFPTLSQSDYLYVEKHDTAHAGILNFHLIWLLEPLVSPAI